MSRRQSRFLAIFVPGCQMNGFQIFTRRPASWLAALSLAAASVMPLGAQSVPGTLNFQGRLTDTSPSQNPLNATVNMQFEIWDVASGGTAAPDRLWREPNFDNAAVLVPVSGGIFSYALGATVPIPASLFTGATSTRYLQIIINPGAAQEILAPRQPLTTTGYAGRAETANNTAGAGSVTNGVYTTGSYADPAWLTSLGGGKVGGTVADSGKLGGIAPANWQKKLVTASCPANQYYTAIAQTGVAACGFATGVETDPKVGTLTTGRVPDWNATSLADGTMYDSGGKVGINTAAPFAPLTVTAGNPAYLGLSTASLTSPQTVFVQGRYAFVASYNSSALVVFDISNPATPTYVGASTAGLSNPQSVYVQGRYAFVADYSLGGALVVFDISNPANPVKVGSSTAGLNQPAAVYVQGRYAFVASVGNNALVIFDISNPASPVNVGASTVGLNYPISVYVQGRYAFVVSYFNNSLAVFDIGSPAGPVKVGGSTTGLNQPNSVYVQGRYAFVASTGNNSLVVFDIDNPASPVNVGAAAAGLNQPTWVCVQGRHAFVVNSGNNTLAVLDISNPAAPVIVGSATTALNGLASVYVQGRYAFVTSISGDALLSFDLGGASIQQLEAGGTETGTLSTRANAQFNGDADVKGGLSVGNGGVYSAGTINAGSLATPGTLSIGVRFVPCPISAPIQDCSCAAGEAVVSGGGNALGTGSVIRESRPISAATWRITCANSAGADINCNAMNILCDRRAP